MKGEKSKGRKICKVASGMLRFASAWPVSVVEEITNAASGCIALIFLNKGITARVSPMDTAWIQITFFSARKGGSFSPSLSPKLSRYLPKTHHCQSNFGKARRARRNNATL